MHATTLIKQLPILIFVSFDGFRHDYLNPALTPNLYDLSKHSTLGHMESLYITKTFPNHFSMATGLYEDEHEIINNKMFDPDLNATFKPGVILKDWWDPNGKTIPIWTANELIAQKMGQRRYSGSMMYPGASTPYQGILPTHMIDYVAKANYTDNIERVLSWLVDPEKPANFVSMYFDEPDTIAHMNGPWGQATLDAVREVDSAAGYLVKRLRDIGLAERTNIIFVSDHGMAEIRKIIYMSDIVNSTDFTMYGNSPDWSVFVRPEKRHLKSKIFQELLAASKKNHYKIFKRADIPPELHYSKSSRIGDFFIIVDEQYDLYPTRPSQLKSLPKVWGNHGWKPTDRDMRPLFMAYGPSFKRDYNHVEPFPNIDLFPLMVFLLALPLASLPNNGSLSRIVDVIDVGHFEAGRNPLVNLVYFFLMAAILSAMSGVLLTLIISSRRPRNKPDVDYEDLAAGLNIDLGYYVGSSDENLTKKKRRNNQESASLLHQAQQ